MKALLAKLLGINLRLLNWFLPIFKQAAAGALTQIMPIAIATVTQLATNNQLGNAEKRAAAFTTIGNEAKAAGIQAGVSVINLAIEAAVAQLKA